MFIEVVKKYYNVSYDLNCAETIVYAANDFYNLNLDKNSLKMMAAYGGGMGIESTCGAVLGALAVLGVLCIDKRAHESKLIKKLSVEFLNGFKERLGDIDCKPLKENHRTDDKRCEEILLVAAIELEKTVKNNQYKK